MGQFSRSFASGQSYGIEYSGRKWTQRRKLPSKFVFNVLRILVFNAVPGVKSIPLGMSSSFKSGENGKPQQLHHNDACTNTDGIFSHAKNSKYSVE